MTNIPIRLRLKELLIDYLVILIYLLLLLLVNLTFNFLILESIPEYTERQAQLIATFTSAVPIILIFSYMDYFKDGSIGKRVAGLKLIYSTVDIFQV